MLVEIAALRPARQTRFFLIRIHFPLRFRLVVHAFTIRRFHTKRPNAPEEDELESWTHKHGAIKNNSITFEQPTTSKANLKLHAILYQPENILFHPDLIS